ncbi:MAG: autotransporter outer membrane beta-barrel domain-containing protein [Turneriella sp.]|nr:autotransporter outer membrane beta-barrel domain-containing protein [Turneriella sp.]
MTRILVATLSLATLELAAAPTAKRLLILNPVNEGSEANAYIGPSLADALRTGLAENYFFLHPEAEAIEAVRKDNLIQEEDLHTKTSALQMGVWLRQDLVLAGKYAVNGNRLKLNLTLYQIETEKALLTFKTEAALSAKMFDTFAKIASDLGKQMAETLPSQQDLKSSGGNYYDPEKGKRTLLFTFGTRAIGVGKITDNLTSASTVSTSDTLHLNAEFSYQRHYAGEMLNRRYKWPVFLQFSLNGGYAQRNYLRDNANIPTRVIAVEGLPAIGYTFFLPRGIRLEPYAGVGFGYANFNFDYSELARKPVDTSAAQSVSSQKLDQFYFFTQAGTVVKYAITPRWAVVFTPSFSLFHYSGNFQGELNAKLGAGFYF